MKIAIDAINGNESIRGPDRYLIGLLQALAHLDRDNDYVIFFAPWQRFYEHLALPGNFHKVRCGAPRHRLARMLWHACVFPVMLRRLKADVLHLPNVILVPFQWAPIVMTAHDLAHFRFPEKFGYLRGYAQRWLIRAALLFARRVIAVSRFTAADLQRFVRFPTERVSVIGEGGPAPINAPREHPDRPYFLYVGQLERSKNVERLVQAFAASEVLRRANVELRIAGKPSNAAARIEYLAKTLAPGRVALVGYVRDEELPGLFGNAIAFVFPSLVEGFGLVLLEAMAYGAPIVAANASVIPEVVGDAALLVDATRVDELRAAMERVYREPELRAELSQRGRERLAGYSWRKTAELTLEEYRRVRA